MNLWCNLLSLSSNTSSKFNKNPFCRSRYIQIEKKRQTDTLKNNKYRHTNRQTEPYTQAYCSETNEPILTWVLLLNLIQLFVLKFGDNQSSGLDCAFVEQTPELKIHVRKGTHSLILPVVIPSLKIILSFSTIIMFLSVEIVSAITECDPCGALLC